MKKIIYIVITILIIILAVWIVMALSKATESSTPVGPTYTEEVPGNITYTNATSDMIKVDTPEPNAVTGKQFSVIGQAVGSWYFEGSFPVQVLDKDGKLLAEGIAKAQGDWMTESLVSFKADLTVPESYIGPATLILKKDNPSGLPAHDASISFPFTIEY